MHNMQFSWLDFKRIFFKLRILIFETWKGDKRDIGIIIRRNWDGYFRKYNRHFANQNYHLSANYPSDTVFAATFFFSKLLFNLVKRWKLNFQFIPCGIPFRVLFLFWRSRSTDSKETADHELSNRNQRWLPRLPP